MSNFVLFVGIIQNVVNHRLFIDIGFSPFLDGVTFY